MGASATTSDLFTRLASGSRTSPAPPHTAWAASRANPPAKMESRRNSARSSAGSRSWLQSSAPRSVRCLASASWLPVVSSLNDLSSRSEIWPGLRVPVLAAASSIARGIPSSFPQTSATARAFPGVRSKPGAARSTKSLAASDLRNPPAEGCLSGNERGGTLHTDSPLTPRTSRLVARILRLGQAGIRTSARRATASTTCSQLSSNRSVRLSRRTSEITRSSGRPGSSRAPTRSATTRGTRSPSASGPNSTSRTPPG